MNKKIVDYCLIYRNDEAVFVRVIREALKDGWELYGSPFSDDGLYCQAMVKYEEQENDKA